MVMLGENQEDTILEEDTTEDMLEDTPGPPEVPSYKSET
jgi:hypothetical protein